MILQCSQSIRLIFAERQERRLRIEKNENLIKDDDIGKEFELKNEPRAHPETKMSSDERGKEEWRNLCEVEKFQRIDMKLGSRLVESIKFESRAGKLIRIFDLGQKKSDIALYKHRVGHGKTEPPD